MSPTTIVFFIGGLIALVIGAEILVRGGVGIARRTGLSPVVIGLTVVAFGTSTPELAVSLGAAVRDEADLALGNVIGSNIANVLLVLGVAAVIGSGLTVARRITRVDVPIMIGASVLVLVLSLNGSLGRLEGTILVTALIAYIGWMIVGARRSPSPIADGLAAELAEREHRMPIAVDALFIVGGLVLLVGGATALVNAASEIADLLGLSELVIGLTVVAIGTSLPEIATSAIAAFHGERELAVGNAVGSNVFNLLAVLGATAAISPTPLTVADGALTIDMPVMIAAAIACLPLFVTGFLLSRWEGAVFLAYYSAYVTWLVLDGTQHGLRQNYITAMVVFVIPLTVITLAVISIREWRRRTARV